MKNILLAILAFSALQQGAFAVLIAHYNGEEGSSPLTDQAGGETSSAVDSGHTYGNAGPAGFGNAIGLTANGSWQLSTTQSAELNLANDFTVAAWIYQDSSIVKTGLNTGNNRILGDDAAWDADGWSFGVRGNQLLFTKNGVVDAFSSGGASVPVDQWVHVAVTISSTSGLTFYLNGALDGTNANTANNNTGLGNNGVADPFAVGRSYGNGEGQYFAGMLDEVRVYDTVLSQTDVQALMVPEPGTALLAVFGLAGFLFRRRR